MIQRSDCMDIRGREGGNGNGNGGTGNGEREREPSGVGELAKTASGGAQDNRDGPSTHQFPVPCSPFPRARET